MSAHQLGNYKTAILILNAPFAFIDSFSQTLLEEKNYFQDDRRLQKYLNSRVCQKVEPLSHPPRNLFLIIIESFGYEFSSVWNPPQIYTPYFDQLIAEGLLFQDCLS